MTCVRTNRAERVVDAWKWAISEMGNGPGKPVPIAPTKWAMQ